MGGTNRWTQTTVGSGPIGYGSVIKAANALVVLTEAGELVLVQPNPDAYTELAKFKVLDLYCWNHVALSNGRIYARNSSLNSEIVALEVSVTLEPLPGLGLTAELTADGHGVKLTVRALDNTSLDTGHAGRLDLQSTTDLAIPPDQWSALDQTFTVTNGTLVTEVPFAGEQSRFLRVREKKGSN